MDPISSDQKRASSSGAPASRFLDHDSTRHTSGCSTSRRRVLTIARGATEVLETNSEWWSTSARELPLCPDNQRRMSCAPVRRVGIAAAVVDEAPLGLTLADHLWLEARGPQALVADLLLKHLEQVVEPVLVGTVKSVGAVIMRDVRGSTSFLTNCLVHSSLASNSGSEREIEYRGSPGECGLVAVWRSPGALRGVDAGMPRSETSSPLAPSAMC